MCWGLRRPLRKRPTRDEPARDAGGDSSSVPIQVAEGESVNIAGGGSNRVPVPIAGGHAGGQVQLTTPEVTANTGEVEGLETVRQEGSTWLDWASTAATVATGVLVASIAAGAWTMYNSAEAQSSPVEEKRTQDINVPNQC
jgi:hypothetical protein